VKTLFLHIGLQKTGTSSLQARLMGPDGPLARAGIDPLPGVSGPGPAHHNAARDLAGHRGFDPALPGISALLAAIRQTSSERVFVSSEDFGALSEDGIETLARELNGIAVRPVICLRNPLDWAESLYAQACKRSLPGSFPAFSARLRSIGRLDPVSLLERWETVFGQDAMVVVPYEDHADIALPVARLLGLQAGQLPPATERANQSLNEVFIAASQSILEDCAAGRLILNGRPVSPSALPGLGRVMLAAGRQNPDFAGSPVLLAPEAAQEFLDRFHDSRARLARRLAPDHRLPARWYTPDPGRGLPGRPRPEHRAWLEAVLKTDAGLRNSV
jgi:hypothetical protein